MRSTILQLQNGKKNFDGCGWGADPEGGKGGEAQRGSAIKIDANLCFVLIEIRGLGPKKPKREEEAGETISR